MPFPLNATPSDVAAALRAEGFAVASVRGYDADGIGRVFLPAVEVQVYFDEGWDGPRIILMAVAAFTRHHFDAREELPELIADIRNLLNRPDGGP